MEYMTDKQLERLNELHGKFGADPDYMEYLALRGEAEKSQDQKPERSLLIKSPETNTDYYLELPYEEIVCCCGSWRRRHNGLSLVSIKDGRVKTDWCLSLCEQTAEDLLDAAKADIKRTLREEEDEKWRF